MVGDKSRTWAEISLDNIARNYTNMCRLLPEGCLFLGVVKADAYGHGAKRVAALLRELGCRWLAVACPAEAFELRAAGIDTDILILGPTAPGCAATLAELGVTQAVGSAEQAQAIAEELRGTGLRLKAHIKLESGMGRTGFRTGASSLRELSEVMGMDCLEVGGAFTHFAVSDEPGEEFTAEQYRRFIGTVDALQALTGKRPALLHCVNSGAMINHRRYCLDMVRPGLALYGLYPARERGGVELLPAMQLRTRIAVVTEHEPGDSVSYGRTFVCRERMKLAVLPIGYADGLHRCLSNNMDVLINGRRARQVGRICMDMCMADVTDIPGVRAGDTATVFGRDGDAVLPVEEQAEKAGTISYELVCAVSRRVPRVYGGRA